MPELFDISEWSEQRWWNTGGTRNKKVYLSPQGDLYFFKQSLMKEGKDYKYEFWSEIIASEIGLLCGFDVLPYHIAVRGNEAGCISKSMIIQGKEELVEGGKYLQAFDSTFDPDDRKLRHQYNFELIASSLTFFKLDKYLKDLIEILVFDALIGNSDRHQENWAFITLHNSLSKSISELEFGLEHGALKDAPKLIKKFFDAFYMVKGKLRPDIKRFRLMTPKETRFAPIYDSGCSFGRELHDEKVKQMITDMAQLESYVIKGLSEIHWLNEKVSHFALINNLLKDDDFKDFVISSIARVREKFSETTVTELINSVDDSLPESCAGIKIPQDRKNLMCKLVVSRFVKLKELI